MNSSEDQMLCQRCGRPRTQSATILSRHTTSDGVIVYTECVCGLLEAWLHPISDVTATLVAQSANGHARP